MSFQWKFAFCIDGAFEGKVITKFDHFRPRLSLAHRVARNRVKRARATTPRLTDELLKSTMTMRHDVDNTHRVKK